jgi:hypothetical protein
MTLERHPRAMMLSFSDLAPYAPPHIKKAGGPLIRRSTPSSMPTVRSMSLHCTKVLLDDEPMTADRPSGYTWTKRRE